MATDEEKIKASEMAIDSLPSGSSVGATFVAGFWSQVPYLELTGQIDEDALVERVLARMPAPEPGQPGKDADPELIRAIVREEVAALPGAPQDDQPMVGVFHILHDPDPEKQKAIEALLEQLRVLGVG